MINLGRCFAFIAACAFAPLAFAQGFTCPDKNIFYWQAFPPGGESDTSARHQQVVLHKKCGAIDVIVQYKPGAGGGVLWSQMNQLPGDGYNVVGINLPHIVFQPMEGDVQYKTADLIMDSQSVGIPRNSPDGYYEHVAQDVNISDGGEFVHAAPWSVGAQGNSNVSHGCVNLAPDNATWFFNFSQRGDIVNIVNSPRPPELTDNGTVDWNTPWDKWVAGSALPVS